MKTQLRCKARRAAQRGMTLIEIMVVLVILSMMAALIGVNVVGQYKESKIKSAQLDVRNLADNGVDLYYTENNKLPDSLQDLVPKQVREIHKDPWGHDYVYVNNGNGSYQVLSYGPDGAQGGGDDIVAGSGETKSH